MTRRKESEKGDEEKVILNDENFATHELRRRIADRSIIKPPLHPNTSGTHLPLHPTLLLKSSRHPPKTEWFFIMLQFHFTPPPYSQDITSLYH